jgi:hypothetical protein
MTSTRSQFEANGVSGRWLTADNLNVQVSDSIVRSARFIPI